MMIARPIVAGPVAGAILGDVATGLARGGRGGRRAGDGGRARLGAAHAPVPRGRLHAARRRGARRRGRGRGARRGHGWHAAPRWTGAGSPLVRSRARRRFGGRVAFVTPALGQSLLRLFTVQGSWNYERMQGIGVGVAEEPLLRPLVRNGDQTAYRAAVARGAHFFNAHPYLWASWWARRRVRSTSARRRSRWSGCAPRCAARSAPWATASCGRGGCRARPASPSRAWRSGST